MITIRKAEPKDTLELLTLIKNINKTEQTYLKYDFNPSCSLDRIIKNLNEGHVLLFIAEEQIVGFYEYGVFGKYVWIYSLYTHPNYRIPKHRIEHIVFMNMIRLFDVPIRFAVYQDNKMMLSIIKKFKAKEILRRSDGFIEFQVGGG